MTKEFVLKFSTIITGAFSFVAALAWNETVKAFIQKYISPGSELKSLFYYAVIVTIIAVVVSYYLNKAAQEFIKQQEKLSKKVDKLETELDETKTKNKNLKEKQK